MDSLIAVARVPQRQEACEAGAAREGSRTRFAHLKEVVEHRMGSRPGKLLSSRIKKKITHLPAAHLENLWLRMRLLDEAVFARGIMQLKREGHIVDVICSLEENGEGKSAAYKLAAVRFSQENGSLEAADKIISRMNALRERIAEVCAVITGTNHFRLKDSLGELSSAAVTHNINNVVQVLCLTLGQAQKGKLEYLLPAEPESQGKSQEF